MFRLLHDVEMIYQSKEMMTFNDFVHKYKIKNKAISNVKKQQVVSSLYLNDVATYLRYRPFSSVIGIVRLHPSKGTHWVCYIDEKYFDIYGCVCPKKQIKFTLKRKRYCLYSEYKIQV